MKPKGIITIYSHHPPMPVDADLEDGFFGTIWGRLFLFFNPFLIAALFLYLLYLIANPAGVFWPVSTGMFAYFFPPAGKESVIPLTVGALTKKGVLSPAVTILYVASAIAFVDIITSYFLLWNLYIAKKIPLIGGWFIKFENFGAQKMKEKPWVKKIAFLGVALFVVFPFQGSGGVGASILGKVIGMNKYHAWTAIIVGSFSGCLVIATISYYLGGAVMKAFETGLFQGIGLIALIAVAFIFIYYFTKNHNTQESKNEAEG